MDWWLILVLGAVGGAIPDLIRVAKAAGDLRYWSRTYLISFIALVVLGALAAWLADVVDGVAQPTVVTALTAGFAGPELVSRLLSKKDPSAGDRVAGGAGFDLRRWWAV